MTEGRAGPRLKLLAVLVACMFCALTVRLWYLQVLASEEFAREADENFIRLVQQPSIRGKILDVKGRVLVDNRPSRDVTVNEDRLGDDAEQVIYRLSRLLDVPVRSITRALKDPKYYDYQPVPVAFDVSKRVQFYIGEHKGKFPGVETPTVPVRTYPRGKLAAHILGYTGQITADQLDTRAFRHYDQSDQVGQAGLEAAYERYLQGEKGVVKYRVNAIGQNLGEIGRREPVPGNNLILNVDAKSQRIVEDSLHLGMTQARRIVDSSTGRLLRATAGAAVVMEPDGAVRAIASWPTFDPKVFTGGHDDQIDRLYEDRRAPLFDRATHGEYPPGSTFKPFIALAAVRDGIATLDGSYDCPPEYVAPGDTSDTVFHNWTSAYLGRFSIADALRVSCDTVFYPWGYSYFTRYYPTRDEEHPEEPLQRSLREFGFGRETGVDLPTENAGRIPDAAWMREQHEANPRLFSTDFLLPGEFIQMTIGQGSVLATPLQLATAYAAIANGGRLCEPRLAAEVRVPSANPRRKPVRDFNERPQCRKLPYSPVQLNYIRNALATVPTAGTAEAAFQGFPFQRVSVAGKTGTAEVPPFQDYSWFAAMAPATNPEYVIVAMVEQGGHGSTTAAPIVRNIIEGLFGLEPSGFVSGGEAD
jgi:penicillin-binding protein 2